MGSGELHPFIPVPHYSRALKFSGLARSFDYSLVFVFNMVGLSYLYLFSFSIIIIAFFKVNVKHFFRKFSVLLADDRFPYSFSIFIIALFVLKVKHFFNFFKGLFSASRSVISHLVIVLYTHPQRITIGKTHKIMGRSLCKLHNKKHLTKWLAVWYNGILARCRRVRPAPRQRKRGRSRPLNFNRCPNPSFQLHSPKPHCQTEVLQNIH